ncbi:MAG: HlyD family efflux transporter periplasmic adaptor subunit [Christensenellales bacterium]
MAVRRRPRFKFFIIMFVVISVFGAILAMLLRSRPTVAVEWASAEFDARFEMLIVRDEVVYLSKNYGKTKFIAEEAQSVVAGDAIAEVYEWGYNDDSLSKLVELQKSILKHQIEERRKGIIDEKLNEINGRIDSNARDIQQAVHKQNNFVMLGLERQMEALLSERMQYLKGVTVPDDHLRDLYEQEEELQNMFSKWRKLLVAEDGGAVSFYFDGCERLMSKENIGKFTRVAIEEVMAGKTVQISQDNQAYAPLYRLVNENEWYVVLLSDKRIPEMYKGNTFSIVFDEYLHMRYNGVVYDASGLENNDGFVYTIMIQDNIGALLGDRRVSARLYGVQESLRIPKSCVITIERADYVETLDGEYIPVDIVADDGEYVLIKNYQQQPALKLGQMIYR